MKLILLAAAAAIAVPAVAQQTGTMTAPQTTPDQAAPPPAAPPPPAADTMAPATPPAPTPPAPVQTTGDPVGGYQPSAPALSGPVAPGATVTFQQAPSPDQAYPAPAPLAKYPVCKKGQYDKCIQRGGK